MKLYDLKEKEGQEMKRTTAYLFGLVIVGVLVSVGIASAFGAGFIGKEQRAAIKKAIEENNFEAWKTAMEQTLTQENFNRLVEKYRLMTERRELQNTIIEAIKEGNFTAYKEAMEKLSSYMMSEEQFNAMVQHYNTTKSGRFGKFVPLYGFGCRKGFGGHHMLW
jgi:hypothetical protein